VIRNGYYDDAHEAYRTACRGFIEHEVVPRQASWEREGIVGKDVWRLAGKQNLLCPWADPAYGGLGLTDLRYEQIMIEELANAAESGFAVPLHSGVVAPYLAEFGTEDQKTRHLTRAVSGESLLAIAITEPGTGSDVAAIRTRAVPAPDGDGWLLNGAKTFISSGINADLVIVAARTGEDHAIGLFLVAADAPGFTRGRKLDKLGLRTSDTAELFFDDVHVPAADVLGGPDQGFALLMRQFALERLIVAMGAVAHAGAALRETVAYTRQRPAFGRPRYAAGSTGLSQCAARTSGLMLRSRSPSTSSTLCMENGMILVPRQWWVSVATSMKASCSTTAWRIARCRAVGTAPARSAAIHTAAISALSGLKNEEL
jgi:alkylation response protein AidB-like acyl-CoA dehydrogenase